MNTIRYSLTILFVVGAAFSLMNCGSAGIQRAVPEKKMSRLDSLEMQVDQLAESISELEETNQKLLARTKGGEFDIESQEGLADKLLQMDDRLALLEDRVDFIDSTRFDMLTRLDQIESRSEGGGITVAPGTTRSLERGGAARALSESEYKSSYQQAYELYRQKAYQQAIPEFIRVIEARPDGDLSDNAQYWIGECYYGMQNYNRAIVEFEKVFTFKNSNKDADAQLKLGLCYLNLGQRQKAREEFQRLVDFYPNSEYRSVATEYLRQL